MSPYLGWDTAGTLSDNLLDASPNLNLYLLQPHGFELLATLLGQPHILLISSNCECTFVSYSFPSVDVTTEVQLVIRLRPV